MAFVLDNSVVMAWCFEDESTAYAERVLDLLDQEVALVPSVWPLELANALCVAERRKRLSEADSARFAALIKALPIEVEPLALDRAINAVLDLARGQHLSCYDAAYLELAMREGCPLATQDRQLREAADRVGVRLVD